MNEQSKASNGRWRDIARRLLGRKRAPARSSVISTTPPAAPASRSDDGFLTSYVVADATHSTALGYMAGGSLSGAILGADAARADAVVRSSANAADDSTAISRSDCSTDSGSRSIFSRPDVGSGSSDSGWTCDSSSSFGSSADSGSDGGSSSFDTGSDSGSGGW
ncbi:hypothetical protein [Burkholderia ubonensis]|uniref:hypothetical protein n=1 Tax=Burkholderia ubonensis TaxID=101571 RepID=UPI0012F93F03|nr:hypothetical protein [Burkholderia ubonensis]